MNKRPSAVAVHYQSRRTVVAPSDTYHLCRDDDGEYSIVSVGADNTVYIGKGPVAFSVGAALQELVQDNEEEEE